MPGPPVSNPPIMSSSIPSLLTSLLDLITSSTHEIQSELDIADLPEPWIDIPALHPWDKETPSKKYWDARKTLISALGMMTAIVQNPTERLIGDVWAYHHPAALNFVVNAHIPDILAASCIDERVGLPIHEISRLAGTHVAKTERVLRFLCIHHIFQETAPAVFANNKVSTCLTKDYPTPDLSLFWTDVGLRSASAFSNTLRAPRTAHSVLPGDASFSEVFSEPYAGNVMRPSILSSQVPASSVLAPEKEQAKSRATMFEFLAHPENEAYCRQFAQGMVGIDTMHGTLGYRDFAWDRWDVEGAVYVDVGASKGHLSLSILPDVKWARFINQDRPETCAEGEKFFAERNPEVLTSGRVVFQPNDFFTRQPVKGAGIYILSNILHDWPEEEALSILRNLADAMDVKSRLLVIEIVVVPSISQSRNPLPLDEDKDSNSAPWPLLKDYGVVNRYAHHQCMELINLFNSLDRTLDEYVALFETVGLELVKVHHLRKPVSIMEVKKIST
ncbi:S-adenosyl-L-methionine-dependent methyltransferase [Ramaria rubella]|nr:S-adenosyl-L-methionine-dependent methyltransferase [Ramaria rubella]